MLGLDRLLGDAGCSCLGSPFVAGRTRTDDGLRRRSNSCRLRPLGQSTQLKNCVSRPAYKAHSVRVLCYGVTIDIEKSTIIKLTSSMDARIVKVLKANGEYIKM